MTAEPPRTGRRWPKVLAAIALVAILVAAGVALTGGPGEHGPGRHTGEPAEASRPAGDHTPPPGAHQPR